MSTARPGRTRYLATSPFNAAREKAAAAIVPVNVGDRVSHDRHGLGRAVGLDGDRAVIVDFGGDIRRVELDSPRLVRL
ncbi:hypothetical protein ICW40_06220 [Actinotalea ferrariae]|uniref:hypothetical protein n=1 Tax=Actinotalea ferrariae TaxID=1386098 RepID=UPI001C8BFE84|nr:hypothetical protein [Actinotalea ferrariae]MBX9244401.1 hypothetical protein [Actinotalea ferrariae]